MNVNYSSKMGPQLLQTSTRTRCFWLGNGTWQLQETREPRFKRNKSHGFGTRSRHCMNEYSKINLIKGAYYYKQFKGFTVGFVACLLSNLNQMCCIVLKIIKDASTYHIKSWIVFNIRSPNSQRSNPTCCPPHTVNAMPADALAP